MLSRYKLIEDIKFLEDRIIISIDKKNIVFPTFYNGEYLDELNLYFIGKDLKIVEKINQCQICLINLPRNFTVHT